MKSGNNKRAVMNGAVVVVDGTGKPIARFSHFLVLLSTLNIAAYAAGNDDDGRMNGMSRGVSNRLPCTKITV